MFFLLLCLLPPSPASLFALNFKSVFSLQRFFGVNTITQYRRNRLSGSQKKVYKGLNGETRDEDVIRNAKESKGTGLKMEKVCVIW